MGTKVRKKSLGRMYSAPEAVMPTDGLPGGRYKATENPDRSWDISDVPIFCEHQVKTRDDKLKVGRKWMVNALEKAQSRFRDDGYLPPLHVNHHGTGREVKRAGFYKLRAVRRIRYEGKPTWCLFADLVRIPSAVYTEIRGGTLPYRSVEIHRIDKPEVDSLALMADEVPFFRLSLLTIGEEIPHEAGPAERLSNQASPALAYRSLGAGAYALLTKLEDDDVQVYQESAEKGRKYRYEDDEEDDQVEVTVDTEEESGEEEVEEKEWPEEPDEKMNLSPEDAGGVLSALREILSTLESAYGGGEGEAEAEAPRPVEMADQTGSVETNYTSSGENVKLLARLDATEGKLAKIERERTIEHEVTGALKDLEIFGLVGDRIEKRLYTLAEKDGLRAMRAYVTAAKELGATDPPSTLASITGDEIGDKTAASFATLGPDGLEAATRYASEYDQLSRRMKLDFDKSEHVRRCLTADGFEVSGNGNGNGNTAKREDI